MGTNRCCTIIMSVWLSMYYLPGSSAKQHDHLSPPTNITFGMDGMFCLLLQWNPLEPTASCIIKYNKSISSKNGRFPPPQERGIHPNFAAHVENVDLNEEIVFIVRAECRNTYIVSKNTSLTIQLATGDPKTSVRNLSCTWHYAEYVQCTWQPGQAMPPDVNYTLLYWTSEESSCTQVDFSQSKQFRDVLPTGSPCYNYTYKNGITNGCQFRFQKSIAKFSKLAIAVSDWSKEVKPYFYYVRANNIAKLKPPVIQTSRTSYDSINISWNDMELHKDLLYEVLVEMSNSGNQEYYKEVTGVSKEILNAASDVTYIVRVRVRLPRSATDDTNFLWSDWSESCTLQGANSGRNLFILLLVLIPVIIIVAAVILLIFMKRLKILIFPKIPDPGKALSNDLQQWLKNGRMVYCEPRKEEICPVSMLETPLTSTPVD